MTTNPDRIGSALGLVSRPCESEADLQRMEEMLMEARARTGDWRCPHVGELAWDFLMVVCHLDPREHIRLWHDRTGRLVGYALLGEDPSFGWCVLPTYEESEIETDAMTWASERLAELRRLNPTLWRGGLVAGAREDDPRARAFLEGQGFRHDGEAYVEVNLMRSLADPILETGIPTGWQIRAVAEVGELPSRAEAQRTVWHPWTVGDISDEDYASLMRLPGYHRDLDVVAVAPDGVIASYVNGWIDPINQIGDFGPLGALPAYRRQGLTRAVLLEALRRMKAHGMNRVCVSTGESNLPARRLYESIGFKIVNRYLQYVSEG